MTSYTTLMHAFQNFLFDQTTEILQGVNNTPCVTAQTRLGIYKNAYFCRLTEALSTTYPMMKRYLGEKIFDELCHAYIRLHPSSFRSIRWFGDQFSSFLSSQESRPFLPELAKLEWTMSLVFDSQDSPIMSVNDMTQFTPDMWATLRFIFHPSVYRLSFTWNVFSLWQALIEETTLPTPQTEASEWILWRQDLTSRYANLSCEEAWAIDTTRQNANFSELCLGLAERLGFESAGSTAASFLKGWLNVGLISAIHT